MLVPLAAKFLFWVPGWRHLGPWWMAKCRFCILNLSLMKAGALGLVHRSWSTVLLWMLLSERLQRVQATVLKRAAPFVLALLAMRQSLFSFSRVRLRMALVVQGLKVDRASPRGSTSCFFLRRF